MIKLIENVKRINFKYVLRALLALLTVVSIAVSYGMLNSYTVFDGNNKYNIVTGSSDVNKILLSAGLTFGEEDTVSVGNNGVVNVDRTYSQIITPATKFTAAQITDSVITYTDDILTNTDKSGMCLLADENNTTNLVPLSVKYVEKKVVKSVKHSYRTVYSNQLMRGETKTTKGSNGEKTITYKQLVIGDVVISSEKVSEEITKDPVDQIETIGTKYDYVFGNAVMTNEDVPCISVLKPSSPIELDANGVPVNYVDVIEGKGSAYSDGNQTSTGVTPRPGYVAVNPKQIPYGTKMYIISADRKYTYGYAIAADTGGFATNGSGRIVDLRFNTKSECYTFGVRNVVIYILPD